MINADGSIEQGDIEILGGKIAAVGALKGPSTPAGVELDAAGMIISPGWIDMQVNGGYGDDLATSPDRIASLATRLPEHGITSWLPTLVSTDQSTRQQFLDAVQVVADTTTSRESAGARCVGAHLEGPLLSSDYRGAHDAGVMTGADLSAELASSSALSLITVAPEHPAATRAIELAVSADIVVGLGHTGATATQARHAADLGATYVTHLFNAMAPLHHRSPGTIGVALTDERLTAGLIVDGIHLSDEIVKICWAILGPERTSLISDSTAALGSPPGTHQLGDVTITIDTDGAVRTPDGDLAGTSVGLDQCLRNLMRACGATLVDAIATVTSTPARVLSLTDRGRILPGMLGDLTLLDANTEVAATVIGGAVAHIVDWSIVKGADPWK